MRLGQSEIIRGKDIGRGIEVLENSLKMVKDENVEVGVEIGELEKENGEVMDLNLKLEVDWENCEKHI